MLNDSAEARVKAPTLHSTARTRTHASLPDVECDCHMRVGLPSSFNFPVFFETI